VSPTGRRSTRSCGLTRTKFPSGVRTDEIFRLTSSVRTFTFGHDSVRSQNLFMLKYLRIASHVSVKGNQYRRAYLGAIGVRSDGTVVQSYNGSSFERAPDAHAEARLSRKLDHGSTVYVARTRRDNGKIAMAKPCKMCQAVMRNRGITKVFYTINESSWGTIEL